MEIKITGKIDDPRQRVLAIEAVTRSICDSAGTDPADGIMMLLTAAVHLQSQYSPRPMAENIETLARCLGGATVAAEGFFSLRSVPANGNAEGAK
ncbi:hypothetical protein TAL182_CH01090 [Rhizobium sp. TAL182]|uniref:hypothetical protein n=1 Tax=Rhizobium sp. TAL182 TaxID=2020313 RepID=UPI000A211424|nr:hypothetical protein [Rhizobium sp. TAL182]ARO22903.1 hypothetical protein TAL182_CH01090 [Rhizobium sp. TAL182]